LDSSSDSELDSVAESVEGVVGALDGDSRGGDGDGNFWLTTEGRRLLFWPPKDPNFDFCGFEVVSAVIVWAGGGLDEFDWRSARVSPKGAMGESRSCAGTAG
jgi:hypothetical protein